MSVELWIAVIVAGFLAQFVDVMTGMGFGAISSSVMLATGLPPVWVLAAVNLVKVGNGMLAGLSHWGFGNVRREWVIPLATSGVLGALTGATLIGRWPEDTVRLSSSVVLLGLGGFVSLRVFLAAAEARSRPTIFSTPEPEASPQNARDARHSALLIGAGFLAGLFNAMSGAYGPFMTTFLVLTRSAPPRYAIGTVSLTELFVAGASTIGLLLRFSSAGFPLWFPAALMAGGALASPFGAYLCRHLPGRILEGFVGLALVSLNLWSMLHLSR